jgi:hypothetical protein
MEDMGEGVDGPVQNLDQFFTRVRALHAPSRVHHTDLIFAAFWFHQKNNQFLQVYDYYQHKGFGAIFLARGLNLWYPVIFLQAYAFVHATNVVSLFSWWCNHAVH